MGLKNFGGELGTPLTHRDIALLAGGWIPPLLASGVEMTVTLASGGLSARLTLAPRLTSILDAFNSKLCSRRRRRIEAALAQAYAGHVEINDSLARCYSRRVRGLRRADPYRIRFRQWSPPFTRHPLATGGSRTRSAGNSQARGGVSGRARRDRGGPTRFAVGNGDAIARRCRSQE